jgi:hypothetical protein
LDIFIFLVLIIAFIAYDTWRTTKLLENTLNETEKSVEKVISHFEKTIKIYEDFIKAALKEKSTNSLEFDPDTVGQVAYYTEAMIPIAPQYYSKISKSIKDMLTVMEQGSKSEWEVHSPDVTSRLALKSNNTFRIYRNSHHFYDYNFENGESYDCGKLAYHLTICLY